MIWIARNLLNESRELFFRSSQWDNNFILRQVNTKFVVYDARRYANMATLDHNYFSYSVMSKPVNLSTAKRIASELYKKENK
jgi:hypothetical protein